MERGTGWVPVVHGLRPKILSVSVSQMSRAPTVASVTSVANDTGDNEMILGAVHLPYSRRKPQKTSARRLSD